MAQLAQFLIWALLVLFTADKLARLLKQGPGSIDI
jgi:hypothetical protein